MKVKCDECEVHFEWKPEERQLEDDRVVTYFTCLECEKEYVGFVKNKEVFELEKERELWQARLNSPQTRKVAKKKLKELEEKARVIMDRLKEEYTHGA